MAVNQQNVSMLQNFSAGAPVRHYVGAAGVMPGAAQFLAAVLCRVRAVADGIRQTLLANLDIPNAGGFGIVIDGDAALGESHIVLTGLVGDGATLPEQNIDLGPGPMNKLMLIHLAVSDTDDFRMYVNGSLVGTVTLGDPTVGSVLAPRVGAFDAAGASSASDCDIVGVAYLQEAINNASLDLFAGNHFDACHRAMAMASPSQLIAPAVAPFTNRFDVREGAVIAGGQGIFTGGILAALPGAAAVWTPSDGAATLTRLGPLPTPGALGDGLVANVITNPVWAYTAAAVPAPEA